jgi:AraC-like DNA-binding protein
MPKEWSQFYTRPNLYDLSFLHADFVNHAFARHVHDYFVIGIIEAGLQTFSYRGAKHATATTGIIILNPDEPHTGEAATPAGFTYKALYPSADLMQLALTESTGNKRGLPFFRDPVIYDAQLARRILNLHHALVAPSESLAAETHLLSALSDLITRHADPKYPLGTVGQERAIVRRAREYLVAHYDQDVSLSELAQVVALSPFHLARVFSAEVGLPPHAYLESIRIRHAQRLLALGQPAVDVALATGFVDQSHFTNRFKRMVGVTPGQFAKQRAT